MAMKPGRWEHPRRSRLAKTRHLRPERSQNRDRCPRDPCFKTILSSTLTDRLGRQETLGSDTVDALQLHVFRL